MPDQQDLSVYARAFEGVLTSEQIQRSLSEKDSHHEAVSAPNKTPSSVLRVSQAITPNSMVLGILEDNHKTAVEHRHTYPDIVSALNGKIFVQENRSPVLEPRSPDQFHEYFPAGKQAQWPALILTTNSDLTSPIEFYKGFNVAKDLFQRVNPALAQKDTVVMGAYQSASDFSTNSIQSFHRANELASNSQSQNNIAEKSKLLEETLLGILVQRDNKGGAVQENGKPVLRADAADILKHIEFFGHSSGDQAVNDVIHILGKKIVDGDIKLQSNDWITMPDGSKKLTLFANAHDVGLAGIYKQPEADLPYVMPKRMNLISEGDGVVASQGRGLYNAPGTYAVPYPHEMGWLRWTFQSVAAPALEDYNAGHDLQANANAAIKWLDGGGKPTFYSELPATQPSQPENVRVVNQP